MYIDKTDIEKCQEELDKRIADWYRRNTDEILLYSEREHIAIQVARRYDNVDYMQLRY